MAQCRGKASSPPHQHAEPAGGPLGDALATQPVPYPPNGLWGSMSTGLGCGCRRRCESPRGGFNDTVSCLSVRSVAPARSARSAPSWRSHSMVRGTMFSQSSTAPAYACA